MKATKKFSTVHYLIIGSGRVARHLGHYFNSLNINYDSWDRSQDPLAIHAKIAKATHVLLGIRDGAIEAFYQKYLQGLDKTVIHFSGALEVEGVNGAHPLMTFGESLYETEFYQKIHFVITGPNSLSELLPGLPNPYSSVRAEDKAKYHALCVMGGNFVTLLIAKMLQEFTLLEIPKEAAHLYLEKVLENTLSNPETALTGPLVRRDVQTVESNLRALKQDSYDEIYRAFLKVYWPTYPGK